MAQRALNADRTRRSVRVEETFHTDHGIQFEQRNGRCRIIEIDLTGLYVRDKTLRKRFRIHFQARFERFCRTHSGTHSPKLFSNNGSMKLQRVAPKDLITESVKAERLLAFLEERRHVRADLTV